MKGVKAKNTIGRIRIMAILLASLFLSSLFLTGITDADLGVSNDPPSWMSVSITEDDEWIRIDLAVKDLNGWSDIFNITVSVYDGRGGVITNLTFSQYRTLSSDTPGEYWNEDIGEYLNSELSSFSTAEIAPWNWQNAEEEVGLNVTFVLTPFSGETIKIVIYDRALAQSEYTGPFSADYEVPPYFPPAIPLSISAIAAAIAAVIFTIRRHYSNKLARTIQASEIKD